MAQSLMAWLYCIFRFVSFLYWGSFQIIRDFKTFSKFLRNGTYLEFFILSHFLIIFWILLHFCHFFTYSIKFFKDLRFVWISRSFESLIVSEFVEFSFFSKFWILLNIGFPDLLFFRGYNFIRISNFFSFFMVFSD